MSESEEKSERKSEEQTEDRSESTNESQSGTSSESQSESKGESQSESKSESQSESKSESQSESKNESHSESKSDAHSDKQSDAQNDKQNEKQNSNQPDSSKSPNFGSFVSLAIVLTGILILLCTVAVKIATTEKINKMLQTHCDKGFCLEVDLTLAPSSGSSSRVTFDYLTKHTKELVAAGVQTIIVKNFNLGSTSLGNSENDIQLFVKTVRLHGIGFFVELQPAQVNDVEKFVKIGAHGFVVKYNSANMPTSKIKIVHDAADKIHSPVRGKVMLEFENYASIGTLAAGWKIATADADIILLPFSVLAAGNTAPNREFYSSKEVIYTASSNVGSAASIPKLYSILAASFYEQGAVINQNDLFTTSESTLIINKSVSDELVRLYHLKNRFGYYKLMGKPTMTRLPTTVAGGARNEFYILRTNESTSHNKYKSFIILFSNRAQTINLQATHGEFGEIIYEYPKTTKTPSEKEKLPLNRIQMTANSIMMIGLKPKP